MISRLSIHSPIDEGHQTASGGVSRVHNLDRLFKDDLDALERRVARLRELLQIEAKA